MSPRHIARKCLIEDTASDCRDLAPAHSNSGNGRETLQIKLTHRDEVMPTTWAGLYTNDL